MEKEIPTTVLEETKQELPDIEPAPTVEGEKTPTFTDGEVETKETQEAATPNGKSSFFAEMRRQREAQEKAKNQTTNNVDTPQLDEYHKGIIEGLGKINPYTKKEMADSFDVEEYLRMKELAKTTDDPVTAYLDILKSQNREQKMLEQQKIQAEQKRNSEFKEFVDEFGMETLQSLSTNEDFVSFADTFAKGFPIKQTYQMYQQFNEKVEQKANDLALEKYARKVANPGAYTDRDTPPKSFASMSDEEFEAYRNKVRMGLVN